MTKTNWYPGHVKPVRVGVYERKYWINGKCKAMFDYWDGRFWSYGTCEAMICMIQGRRWRGLTAKAAQ